MHRRWPGLLLASALCGGPALAAPAACEATGVVVDQEGNPLEGVLVSFTPREGKSTTYSGKTNKKGRFDVPGMFASQGDSWTLAVELEGYLPTAVKIESRTVNRVLIGDVLTKQIKPGGTLPEVVIRPLGNVRVDLTLGRADALRQAAGVTGAAAGMGIAQPGAGSTQSEDPWDMALSRASTGDLAGSVPFFDKAIADKPQDAERRESLAKVLYQLERYDQAEAHARAAIELAPDSIDSRLVLASVCVARKDMAGAKAALETARQKSPQDLRVLRQLAYVAGEAGQPGEAIAAYEAVAAVAPQNVEAWISLGNLYAAAGQPDKSEQAYQRVIALEPKDAHQMFFNLGALIMNKNERTDAEVRKAIAAFRKAIELKPDYALAHKQLAFALLGVGDRAGARAELESYVQHAPGASDAAQTAKLIESLQ